MNGFVDVYSILDIFWLRDFDHYCEKRYVMEQQINHRKNELVSIVVNSV